MWQIILPSPHLHYFDPANLTSLLRGSGFTHVHSAEPAALRADGLKERLAYVGRPNPVKLNAQYLAIRAMIPLLGLFPSDIIVGIYRRG